MSQTFQEIEIINRLKIDYVMKGDIFIGSGTTSNSTTSDINILPVGASGSVLIANTSATYGVKWDNSFVRNFPQSASDNRIARWNQLATAGSVGQYIQSSNIVIDDNRNITECRSIVAGATGATRQSNYLITIKGNKDTNGMHSRISDNAATIGFHIESANKATQYMHIHREGNITFGTSSASTDPQPLYRLDVRADDNLPPSRGGGKINCFRGYFLNGDAWPSWQSTATNTLSSISASFGANNLLMLTTIPATNTTSDYFYSFTATIARTGGGNSTSYTTCALYVNGVQQTDSLNYAGGWSTVNARETIKTCGIITNVAGGSTVDVQAAATPTSAPTYGYFERSLILQRYSPQ